MAERLYRVELTASFLGDLGAVEAFLLEADAGPAFNALLAELRASVIPNLSRFPRIGRRYLDNPRSRPRRWPSSPRCPPAQPTPCANICMAIP